MKNFFFLGATILIFNASFAQVGVNNTDPKATMDITALNTNGSTAEGLIAPRLTGEQIKAGDSKYGSSQTGALVYATTAVTTTSPKTLNIKTPGYYYFNGAVWVKVASGLTATPKFFYMPSIVLPTAADQFITGDGFSINSANEYIVNLHTRYSSQFNTPKASSTGAVALQVLPANALDYFVTYSDDAVFENVTVSADGVLSYKVKANAIVTNATFMNIVFAVK